MNEATATKRAAIIKHTLSDTAFRARTEARFSAQTNKTPASADGCWEWLGAKNPAEFYR